MSAYISPTACTIGPNGISCPTYAQILAYLQAQYLAQFGIDVFLGNDAQDFQLMATYALALSDANATTEAVFNSFSPATAQGVGLSSVVQINGLSRLVPTFSSAPCTLTGAANAVITNGAAIDPAGNIWALPATVTIGSGGTVNSVAVCTTPGSITLAANALSINTPQFGWTAITNSAAAVGAPVETDAALRVRQAVSVSLPSQTVFEGIVAAIENTAGIGRVEGYENNTSVGLALHGGTLPANNLLFVCEGGTNTLIWNAIFSKITPGIPTYADPAFPASKQSTTITDTNGSTRLINYMTPIEQNVNVSLSVHALSGAAASTIPLIQAAVAAYINSLGIGANISIYAIVAAAQLVGTPQGATFELVQPTQIQAGGSFVSTDIQLNYNVAPVSNTITINLV